MSATQNDRRPTSRNMSPVPKVQYKFVMFAAIVASVTLMPALFLEQWMMHELASRVPEFDPQTAIIIEQMILMFKERLVFTYILCMILMGILSLVGGLILTQKTVGPIYKTIRHLELFNAGENVGDLKLRDHDEFKETLEPAINQTLRKIKS